MLGCSTHAGGLLTYRHCRSRADLVSVNLAAFLTQGLGYHHPNAGLSAACSAGPMLGLKSCCASMLAGTCVVLLLSSVDIHEHTRDTTLTLLGLSSHDLVSAAAPFSAVLCGARLKRCPDNLDHSRDVCFADQTQGCCCVQHHSHTPCTRLSCAISGTASICSPAAGPQHSTVIHSVTEICLSAPQCLYSSHEPLACSASLGSAWLSACG